MSTRERRREEEFRAAVRVPDSAGGNEGLSAAADHFLRQADRAIDRGLSGDSEAFLNGNRQDGGQ